MEVIVGPGEPLHHTLAVDVPCTGVVKMVIAEGLSFLPSDLTPVPAVKVKHLLEDLNSHYHATLDFLFSSHSWWAPNRLGC